MACLVMEILKESFIIGASGSNHVFIGMLPVLTNGRHVLFSRHLCVAEFMRKAFVLLSGAGLRVILGLLSQPRRAKLRAFV